MSAAEKKTVTVTCYKCGHVDEMPALPPLSGYAPICGPCNKAHEREVSEFERFDLKTRANNYYGRGR